jgi:uncharacterized protein (DUF433 family)
MATLSSTLIRSDPEILGGMAVFAGTRVPFRTLLEYLEGGDSLAEFLEDFPTVSREHAIAALRQAGEMLMESLAHFSPATR